MPFPWTPNTPQPQQTISSTTGLISNNFLAIQDWTNVDHVQINGALNDEGKHNKVTLMNQPYVAGGGFAPSINLATGIGSTGIYAAQDTVNTGPSRMWAVIPKKAGAAWVIANIPFTESTILFADPTATSDGYTWLPSGILIQYGSMTVTLPNQANVPVVAPAVNFPIAFPTQCFRIIVSPSIRSVNPKASICSAAIISLSQFQATACYTFVTTLSGTESFNYIAIGC